MNTANDNKQKSIWIYTTNIDTSDMINQVEPIINAQPEVMTWSVDTEDVDNVLRVEVKNLAENHLETLLSAHGFYCCAIED